MTTETGRCEIRGAERMRGLRPYVPPAHDDRVELVLDANEGQGPTDAVLSAIAALGAEDVRRYPKAGGLEAELAGSFGISPSRVVVTNGGDDAIDRLCRSVIEPGRSMASHSPTFEMIARGAKLAGGEIRSVDWIGGDFPTQALVDQIDDSTGMVALVTPNNPTGGVIPTEDVRRVVASARASGAVVLVDLAYVEFADTDPTPELLDLDNVVLVRTFSKAFGMAGLRVGYAIAPEMIADWLRICGGPYPVSAPSLAVASLSLARGGSARDTYVGAVRCERTLLAKQLESLGARPLASEANFVSAYVRDAGALRDALMTHGLSIRSFSGGGALENLVRITLPGDRVQFERLRLALDEIGAL